MDFSDEEEDEAEDSQNPFTLEPSKKKSTDGKQEEDFINSDYVHGFRHEFTHSKRAKTNYDVNNYEEPHIEHGVPHLEQTHYD